jgi:hypothetical protein
VTWGNIVLFVLTIMPEYSLAFFQKATISQQKGLYSLRTLETNYFFAKMETTWSLK